MGWVAAAERRGRVLTCMVSWSKTLVTVGRTVKEAMLFEER